MSVAVRWSVVASLLLAACGSGSEAEIQDSGVTAEATTTFPAPLPASAAAQGPIEAFGDATLTVATIRYSVVAGQTIIRRGNVVVPFAALKQGDSASVKGAPAADGTLVAQAIDAFAFSRSLPKLTTLVGAIAVGADSVTVLGQTLRVDAHTLIVRGGRTLVPLSNLRPGEPAQVNGAVGADGILRATMISVRD
jgi:Domain of unknown function (DUF5666)